jgi:hypothetical protein
MFECVPPGRRQPIVWWLFQIIYGLAWCEKCHGKREPLVRFTPLFDFFYPSSSRQVLSGYRFS